VTPRHYICGSRNDLRTYLYSDPLAAGALPEALFDLVTLWDTFEHLPFPHVRVLRLGCIASRVSAHPAAALSELVVSWGFAGGRSAAYRQRERPDPPRRPGGRGCEGTAIAGASGQTMKAMAAERSASNSASGTDAGVHLFPAAT
jgi:hypothetical protein